MTQAMSMGDSSGSSREKSSLSSIDEYFQGALSNVHRTMFSLT